MVKFAYLVFNVLVSLSFLGAALWMPEYWRRWRGLVAGFATVSGAFILWDIWAAAHGHWQFSSQYTLGLRVAGLPIEEGLFFVTVPGACMVVWELLGRTKRARQVVIHSGTLRSGFVVLSALCLLGGMMSGDSAYTRAALLAAGIAAVCLACQVRLAVMRQWWLFQVASFTLFLVCNMVLTGLPIVLYSLDHFSGLRIGTIPIEDFAYNFALLNLFLLVYEWAGMHGYAKLKNVDGETDGKLQDQAR